MIRIAIVDDDALFIQKFRKEIERLFQLYGTECTMISYSKGTDFLSTYNQTDFDLVFLDIDIPGMSGIEIASELRKKTSVPTLIFVSAHDNFVFESIHYAPFRFIRKGELTMDTEEAIRAFCKNVIADKKIIALDLEGENIVSVDTSEIMYFFSLRHDIYLYNSRNETIRLTPRSYTMDKLEKITAEKNFVRAHKTYLVNCDYIYKIKTEKIILKNNSEIPMSRIRTVSVKEQYQLYLRRNNSL